MRNSLEKEILKLQKYKRERERDRDRKWWIHLRREK